MPEDPRSVEEYLAAQPPERRTVLEAVRGVVNEHLPAGYVEQPAFGMIGWVVPLSTFPDTYNDKPLSYVGLAAQKRHHALYLMGLHPGGPEEAWLRAQYAERGLRLDLGKSCLRFQALDDLPLDVIGEVVAMVPPEELVARHEAARRR